jgi:putative endonuclease
MTDSSGASAEALACHYLEQQGLKLIARNYRCKSGEIDLIMQEGQTLVFVEVRLRSNHRFGNAASSIDARKQRKLIHTAEHYLQLHGNRACRFDAILLDKLGISDLVWIRNAFDAHV